MSSPSAYDRSRPQRYTAVAIGLHWAMAVALIGLILVGWNMGDLPGSHPMKATLYQMHKSVGITLLFLTLARLGWRVLNPPPPPPPMPVWQHRASEAAHWVFYGLMLLMPITGWILVSASTRGHPTVIFGMFTWPHIPVLPDLDMATKRNLAPIFHNLHGKLAWVMLPLLGLHVAAALKHQFVDRDGLIARMAPKLFGASSPPAGPARGAWLVFAGSALLFVLIAVMGQVLSPRSGSQVHNIEVVDANWLIRDDDRSLGFSGTHEGNRFDGTFTRWRAGIRFMESDLASSAVQVWIDMTSARTGDSYYDSTLISGDWFDARNHPAAIFTSSSVRGRGGSVYDIDGVLSIKGRDHPVSVPATIVIDGNMAQVQLSFELDRVALGIGVSSDPGGDWVGRVIAVSARMRADRISR